MYISKTIVKRVDAEGLSWMLQLRKFDSHDYQDGFGPRVIHRVAMMPQVMNYANGDNMFFADYHVTEVNTATRTYEILIDDLLKDPSPVSEIARNAGLHPLTLKARTPPTYRPSAHPTFDFSSEVED